MEGFKEIGAHQYFKKADCSMPELLLKEVCILTETFDND